MANFFTVDEENVFVEKLQDKLTNQRQTVKNANTYTFQKLKSI